MMSMIDASPQKIGVQDVLCELMNIGSGRALTGMSRLLRGASLTLGLPESVGAGVVETLGIGDLRASGMVISLPMHGPLPGVFLLVADDLSARSMAQQILSLASLPHGVGFLEHSALLELGNIAACSFLDAVAHVVGGTLMPGPPRAQHGVLGTVVHGWGAQMPSSVCWSTQFLAREQDFGGRFICLWEHPAAATGLRRFLGQGS